MIREGRTPCLTLFVFWVVGLGCQTKPTEIRETLERRFEGSGALVAPIALNESIAVVDARPAFDYSMARIPRSVNFQWSDFSEAEPLKRGWPQRDLFAAARRLARSGIRPETPVVIFGLGKAGQGEEGRLAWFLAYLGVENVQFARFGSVKARLTNAIPPGFEDLSFGRRRPESPSNETLERDKLPQEGTGGTVAVAPLWKPKLAASLIVTRAELKVGSKELADGRRVHLIDVREAKKFLGKSGGVSSRVIPHLEAVNIPWQVFFDEDLRLSRSIAQKLKAIGIEYQDRIIVIDSDGVSSAAVTMALRGLGFSAAGLYAGGYNDLMGNPL